MHDGNVRQYVWRRSLWSIGSKLSAAASWRSYSQATFHGQQQAQPVIVSGTAPGFTYSYTSVPPVLRRSQIALYVVSVLQFLVAAISVSVYIDDSESPDTVILIIDAFLFGCSIFGLMAASGRSRIVLGTSILTSLFVLVHSSLLLSFFDKNCKTLWSPYDLRWECDRYYDNGGSYSFSNSRYRGMLANLSFNVVLAIGGIVCSITMLASSFIAKDVRP